jgi:hypothetical protein
MRTFVLSLGIVWGIAMLVFGVIGSFALGSVHLAASLVVLVCGCLGILPISILSIWHPRVSAGLLLLFTAATACSVGFIDGASDAGRVFLRMGFENLLLAAGYVYTSPVGNVRENNAQ